VNLFLTMLLAGLWHGAAWTFVVFGALHGVYLTIERIRLGGDDLDMSWPTRATGWLRQLGAILLTFHLHCISLVLFRSPSVASAWVYLKGIARFDDPLAIGTPVLFAMGAMTLWDAMQIRTGNHTWLTSLPRPVRFVIVQMLLVSIVAAAIHHVNTVVPFIYFQF
jgi:D-alanyl-lipoteichoic acid acyltransferase DltB (MBOAT superfamily)